MLLSQSQLFRKLKALTGRSVAIHIRGIRLQKSRELLQNSEFTISEVAYDCGFTDPAYFSRTFSKEFGRAPSSFRRA
jgi:AraC-like DNA-binding protein